jgi:NTE family protein
MINAWNRLAIGAPSRGAAGSLKQHFDFVALVLQGGGALGAYQAGVYEALAEASLEPDWVAGISIGAVNAAIISGNPPQARVDKLRQFWEAITCEPIWSWNGQFKPQFPTGEVARHFASQVSATSAIVTGVPGFFTPRPLLPWLYPSGTPEATSWYDAKQLKQTLESVIDFDRINSGEVRLSVGAVNVETGNFLYFDTDTHTIGPEHIMASGALPPSFAPVEIEGEFYWDGGLVSNTPLQWVVDGLVRRDSLTFQVDLWSARGGLPRNLAEALTREKEIRYSSRTRAVTDFLKDRQKLRGALAKLLPLLPDALKQTPEAELLESVADDKTYRIVHLIYRGNTYESYSKDFEFSRASMEQHWRAGYYDTIHALRSPRLLERPRHLESVLTLDAAVENRELVLIDPARETAERRI